jgi:hypothetical protein
MRVRVKTASWMMKMKRVSQHAFDTKHGVLAAT